MPFIVAAVCFVSIKIVRLMPLRADDIIIVIMRRGAPKKKT
jgi:hypothetical protein